MRSEELEFLSRFLSGAAMGVLMPWIRDDMKGDLSEQTQYLIALHDENLLSELLDGTPLAESEQK